MFVFAVRVGDFSLLNILKGMALSIWKKETYVAAIAPGIGLLGVYAYESGRYRFLMVPSELIDLPVNRLLMGGGGLAVLFTALLALVAFMSRWMTSKTRFGRSLPIYLSAFIVFGLPSLFHSTTWSTVVASMLFPFFLALGMDPDTTEKAEPADRPKLPPWVPNVLWLAFMSLMGAWLVSGFGYFSERTLDVRLCSGDQLVAGVRSDQWILKPFDPKSGQISETTRLMPMENTSVVPCRPSLVGGRGIAFGGPPDDGAKSAASEARSSK